MSTQGMFAQRGNTKRIRASVGNTPFSSVQMARATAFPPASDYIITNFGPSVAYIGWGPGQDTAVANAAAPITGDSTGAFCFAVYPGKRSIEAKDGAWFAATTESGTADILITPGSGLVDGFGVGNAASGAGASEDALTVLALVALRQRELMEGVLVELRTLTEFIKQGLNVGDDPDAIRSDQAASIN